ncbi:MAG: molybdenum cofactor guanylyltransferase [Xenococcaceae cyanobacterium]
MAEQKKISIAAIVLAGGKSSRMGRDKASIAVGNTTLLHLICTVADKCASNIYVVTPWTDRYRNFLPANCQLIFEDETKRLGPLVAFKRGLAQIKTNEEWVLLLACDLPLLNESILLEWCDYLTQVPENFIAALPKSEKGWEPLCGFYRTSCLPLLEEYVREGGRSFQTWLAKHQVKELLVSDRRVLFNCNTPDDLAKISKI